MTIDPMDPAALRELLLTLRDCGVASAHVTPQGVNVVFEPQFKDPMPGEAPQPGGWKSPQRLDNMDQFDAPREAP